MIKSIKGKKNDDYKVTVLAITFLLAFATLIFRGFSLLENYHEKEIDVEKIKYKVLQMVDLNELTVEQRIRRVAKKEGYNADYLVALAKCESSLDQFAIGDQANSYGIFQINQGYWPDTKEIALDIEESTRWTINQLKQDRSYLWSCSKKI